jgi:cysteine desulfurase family protein
MRRIYLDNAATSWPKPEAVYDAVDHYQRQLGAPAGRGVYDEALQVDRRVQQARVALARLIDAPDASRVVFAYSGTDALTLAIRGLLRRGDHVVTSVCEHNSILRPLSYLEKRGEISVARIGCDGQGRIDPADVAANLRQNTRLVALAHASNVTGAVQPIERVADRMAGHPARLLVDAAQSVGHLPLSVRQLRCDLLAAPAHKGLLAPTGTGFLYLAPGVDSEVEPWRLGGTGSQSHSDQPPEQLPDRYEAGNLNVPGILGLAAGIAFLQDLGLDRVANHERQLTAQLVHALAGIPHITMYGPEDVSPQRVGVVSFNVRGHDPQEVATLLDQLGRVQVRAGFHCAPLMHKALATDQLGGTVRVSCGPLNEPDDVAAAISVIKQLAL